MREPSQCSQPVPSASCSPDYGGREEVRGRRMRRKVREERKRKEGERGERGGKMWEGEDEEEGGERRVRMRREGDREMKR